MTDLQRLPFHPLIPGMQAIGLIGGKPVWPVMGGAPDDDPPTDPPADPPADPPNDPDSGPDGDRGFPANTRVADMKPEEQAAYWRFYDRRKGDQLKAYKGITPEEALRLKNEDEQRRLNGLPPDERALEDARTEARTQGTQEAASQWAPMLADEIATRFIPDDDARQRVMAGIDPLKFVKDGQFDRQGFTDHFTGLATAFGGAVPGINHQPRQWGQGGNGRKPPNVKASDEGLAEAKRRGYIKD